MAHPTGVTPNPLHREAHQLPLDVFLSRVGAAAEGGLAADEVARRQDQYGPNELDHGPARSELRAFLGQFRNVFALLLGVGSALSFLAEWVDPGQGNQHIGVALLGVVLLNAVFSYVQERQTERIIASVARMLPRETRVRRGGRELTVPIGELVPGDLMLLAEGDRVPADARLVRVAGLKVDNSSLTGESEPQLRSIECTHAEQLESRNMLFSGTLVLSGAGDAVVFATGRATQLGRIVELTGETDVSQTPIRREINHFIRIISTIAVTLGVAFCLVSIVMGRGAVASLIFGIGIIVANVPEGLLPTVTLALTLASRRMAKRNAVIRHLESVETLGSTTVICTDKTGTLTQNRMSAHSVWLAGREQPAFEPLSGAGSLAREVTWALAVCNNARPDEAGGYTGDPTEIALREFARDQDGDCGDDWTRLAEEPFDSSTRRMTVLACAGDGVVRAAVKGAPEVVVEGCARIMDEDGPRPMGKRDRERVQRACDRMAQRGERVLAVATRDAAPGPCPETGFDFLALVGLQDPLRPEVPEAIATCHTAGIRVVMISGDHASTARAIGLQAGLVTGQPTVVTGAELQELSDARLKELVGRPEVIFARATPEHKLRIVQGLKARGEVVTVTGDGVNDAPALKHADMGVAMGLSGTEVAREAADMVLLDDNFASIVNAVEEGRAIFDNIKKFVAYILTSNVPEILPFLAFALLPIPLPLTVVLILAIDLGTDIVPALGLGKEKPETDVMKRPPRARHERLLTAKLLGMSYGVVGMVQAAAGFFSFFVVLAAGGWVWGQDIGTGDPVYREALSAFFASIVICQVADVLICRTRRESILRVGVFSNPLVWIGIAVELGLLGVILYVPALNTIFGTAPLSLEQLCLSLPFAAAILLGDELRKLLVRRGNKFVLRWLCW